MKDGVEGRQGQLARARGAAGLADGCGNSLCRYMEVKLLQRHWGCL